MKHIPSGYSVLTSQDFLALAQNIEQQSEPTVSSTLNPINLQDEACLLFQVLHENIARPSTGFHHLKFCDFKRI